MMTDSLAVADSEWYPLLDSHLGNLVYFYNVYYNFYIEIFKWQDELCPSLENHLGPLDIKCNISNPKARKIIRIGSHLGQDFFDLAQVCDDLAFVLLNLTSKSLQQMSHCL